MTDKEWTYKTYKGFEICPVSEGEKVSFYLDVTYQDLFYPEIAAVDALDVYEALKEYFKGSKYE